MRELIITTYKQYLDSMNEYWKGWGDKNSNIKPYPDFDKMTDRELLDEFMKVHGEACIPRG